ncbi:hypothetical protein B0A52_02886 [Exophiala mesophila]|uniref:Uncharacterized protein n=1 Tax=Exophiala mesophila TaxID=212818 RepID=A0A438NE50_EXOME|nr:hypothetical protein B0A52_02886 [Exophiala mesophila]
MSHRTFGRSPFEAPLRDEEGDFIVGPNTQRNNASGYIQEFDARGHPHNERSEHSRLKLRRAQNDVLSIVGVVVKRAETNQSRWDAMTSKQKDQHLSAETVAGTLCRSLAEVYRRLSTRWIVAMRRRTMCFRSNLGLPFTSTIVSEWNTVGARAFFFGGYPLAAVSEISQTFRNNILEENLVPEPTRLLRRIRSRAQETSKQDIIRLCEDVLCVVFNFWERNFQVRRGLLPVEMCAQLKHTFFQRVAVYYSDMNRRNRDPRSRVRLPDQTLRILALQYTMSDHHIDTVEVDLATDLTMDDAASVSSVSGSTSTPDPHDLDIETTAQEVDDTAETVGAVLERASSTRESVEQGHMSPEVAGQDAPNTVQELDEILGEPEPPTPTWQTLVEESGARNEMEEETWARVSTPIPGISRASSLAQAMPRPCGIVGQVGIDASDGYFVLQISDELGSCLRSRSGE